MGLLPSASTGESTPVFEPIHGSWPQAKGLNIANPLAQILSVAMLFEYFDLKEEGALIRKAVDASLDENVRTPEIQVAGGAKYGTKEVGQWIVDYIRKPDNFSRLSGFSLYISDCFLFLPAFDCRVNNDAEYCQEAYIHND